MMQTARKQRKYERHEMYSDAKRKSKKEVKVEMYKPVSMDEKQVE
jgi:hypothetical protein